MSRSKKNVQKDEIKKRLNKLPDVKLKDVEHCWIEIMIERLGGNRRSAAKKLGISICKLRRYITYRKIDAPNLIKVGRPRKEIIE